MDFQIENIKQIMDEFDLAALFPEITDVMSAITVFARLAVMAGPLILLGLGLQYYLAAPREANYSVGYRFRWGMGSVDAWQFTQKLAGISWSLLGLVLTVVMGILSSGFVDMPVEDMLWKAFWCLFWQGLVIGLSCLVINGVVISRFDRKGNRRATWKELFQA